MTPGVSHHHHPHPPTSQFSYSKDKIPSPLTDTPHSLSYTQFSGKANEGFSFEPALDRQLTSFITLLERKYLSSGSDVRPFDMAEQTQFFALDAIGDISLGQPFGYLEKDQDLYQYNKINRTSLPVMNAVSVMPALASLIHTWPLRLLLPKEGDQSRLWSTDAVRLAVLVSKSSHYKSV